MEKKQNSLGVACFVLGIVGLVTCIFFGAILGWIGIVLGVIGLFLKNRKKGLNIAGLVMCCIACMIGSIFYKNVDEALTKDTPKKVLKDGQKAKDEKSTKASKEEFKIGDTAEISGSKITLLSFKDYTPENKFYKPENNNKYVKAEFEIENIKDKDLHILSTDFKCYTDGYAAKTEHLLSKPSINTKLSKGKKVKGCVCFQIPKNAKDTTIEYESDWISNSKVTFKCKK